MKIGKIILTVSLVLFTAACSRYKSFDDQIDSLNAEYTQKTEKLLDLDDTGKVKELLETYQGKYEKKFGGAIKQWNKSDMKRGKELTIKVLFENFLKDSNDRVNKIYLNNVMTMVGSEDNKKTKVDLIKKYQTEYDSACKKISRASEAVGYQLVSLPEVKDVILYVLNNYFSEFEDKTEKHIVATVEERDKSKSSVFFSTYQKEYDTEYGEISEKYKEYGFPAPEYKTFTEKINYYKNDFKEKVQNDFNEDLNKLIESCADALMEAYTDNDNIAARNVGERASFEGGKLLLKYNDILDKRGITPLDMNLQQLIEKITSGIKKELSRKLSY